MPGSKYIPSPVLVAFLFGIVFFIFQISQINRYGISTDVKAVYERGKSALACYFQLFQNEASPQDHPRNSLEKFSHPPLFSMGYYLGTNFFSTLFNIRKVHGGHLFLLAFSSGGIFFLFLLVFNSFGMRVAVGAILLLILYPPFLAHSQYNPKDVPIMIFFVIAFYLYLNYLRTSRARYLMALAGIVGLAGASHLYGLLLFFIVFIFLGLSAGSVTIPVFRIPLPKYLTSLVFAGIFVVVVFLACPPLWGNRLFFWHSLTGFINLDHSRDLPFLGTVYNFFSLPFYYEAFSLFASLPIVTTLFFIAGVLKSFFLLRGTSAKIPWFLIYVWFAAPVAVATLPGFASYDGMRHLFPCIPPLIILSSLGANVLYEQISKNRLIHNLINAKSLTLVLLLFYFFEIKSIYPYGGSYQNNLIRFFLAPHMEESLVFEDWDVSFAEGVDWINRHAPENSVVCAPLRSWLLEQYPLREDLKAACDENSDFIFLSTRNLFERGLKSSNFTAPPLFVVSRQRSDLLRVYSRSSLDMDPKVLF